MTLPRNSVLALRLNRRLVAAAVVESDVVAFRDSRYFRGPVDRAEATVLEFVDRLLADLQPGSVAVCDMHSGDPDVTSQSVLRAIDRRLQQSGLSVTMIAKSDLLASWGLTGLHGWTDLRGVVQNVWPELSGVRESVRPYISDAVALSMYANCRVALQQPTD